MGWDYALVHLKYTIPPALILTALYRPFCTRLDVYRILFLITIAVVSTIPWDSYLIRTNIWSYPEDVIVGPKIFDIPLEEVFFFVIQTYNTSLLWLFLNKPTLHAVYIRYEEKGDAWRYYKLFGQLAFGLGFKKAVTWVREGKEGTYMGLILVWAIPFLVLLWNLAYQFILGLPWTNTALPIVLPTLYLWVVDTLALNRGTWVIETGTKLGIQIWPGLEVEEAVFFLTTNTLIVCGLVAFDNAIAILNAFPSHFPSPPALPSPVLLVRALLLPSITYDGDRIAGIQQAVRRLQQKSRSFFLASSVFTGRLRIDLILLYSYCRVADDLIDNSKSAEEAKTWIKKLSTFLDLSYKSNDPTARDPNTGVVTRYIVQNFPRDTHSALLQLQTDRLSAQPLYDLLKGFNMDLDFESSKASTKDDTVAFPIKTADDLDLYGERVAGTVAELCIGLVFFHHPMSIQKAEQKLITSAGGKMGVALQYTNIARDISVDAKNNRLYIPTSWLKDEGLRPEETLRQLRESASVNQVSGKQNSNDDFANKMDRLRSRLLDRAFALYEDARPAIEKLPIEARAPMRVAVESYMEIGRTLRKPGYVVKAGRATVPKWRRLVVAYNALRR